MRPITLILLFCCLFACSKEEEEPKYFNSKFYAVHQTTYSWEQGYFFTNQPITAKLESRIDFEDRSRQGRFEPLMENTAQVYLDRDLFVDNDTILSGSNLLLSGVAEIELQKVPLNNEVIPDSYIIWINRQNQFSYNLNNEYYTVYLNAMTQNQNQIQDSIIVFVQ
jgi:hypothetical protein